MIDFVATDAEKNNFFNGQLYKGDIGQNFEEVKKKWARGVKRTRKTNDLFFR